MAWPPRFMKHGVVHGLRPPTTGAAADFAFGHKITQALDAVAKSLAERRPVRVEKV